MATKAAKKPVTFRLSETTRKELEQLARRHQVTQADVIAVLAHCASTGADLEQMDEYFEIAKLS